MATITVPQSVPSPADDCITLMNAFRGFGTDEKAIIRTLGHRNVAQRQQIREAYLQLHNQSLIDGLNSELSGDFGRAVILWTYDPAERDARIANAALTSRRKGITELQAIVEIACAASPNHVIAVRKAYCSLFDCSLEEDIISKVPLPSRKILVSLVSSFRHDKQVVDSSIASNEAAKLHDAIEAKKLDDDDLIMMLSTRNVFQLRETFKQYRDCFGKSIVQDIMACGEEGILQSLLKVVIMCIDCPQKHFAEVIRTAILGLGTDEDSLTRVIVTRAEIDLTNIRAEYVNTYKSKLNDDVIGDTSGDYKDFLMTLLGADI